MLEGLQFGTMGADVITGTQVGQLETAFQLNDLPFLYANSAQAHEVLDGEVGQELLKRLEVQGIKGLGFAEAGFRHTINNVRPVAKPNDFKGIKLRVQPSDLFIDSFRAIGANPTPMAWSDEVAILAFIWTIFLFSSALVRDFGHVRVALLLDALPRVAANCCNPRLRRTNCFSLVGSFVASLVYQGHA